RFDAPSIFSSILDEDKGGYWSIEPANEDASHPWESRQHYMRNTNVLVTVFNSPDGSHQFEIIDFMPRFERNYSHHKPPQIVRVLRPLKGLPKVVVRCRPRFKYGRDEPKITHLGS